MTESDTDLPIQTKSHKAGSSKSQDKESILPELGHHKRDNQRQHKVSWPAFVMIQFLFLVGAVMFYKSSIAPKLGQGTAAGTTDNLLQLSLSRAESQITALQKQLDAQAQERERTTAQLQEMTDRMALVLKQSSFLPSGEKPRVTEGDAAQVASMMPSVSPSTSELILLKERNRLSEYADKAIALGSRDDLQAIVDAMFDPAMKHLNHACQAEFRRVQNYYEYSLSIDPGFTLPLQELFKDGSVRAEADLKYEQLAALLQDLKQPWEFRLRSAFLLRASTDKNTNQMLLKALKEDPSLDVAKQAQTTFEKRVGRKFRLFDIPTIEAWWESQKGK
jgi:hypothetical protein